MAVRERKKEGEGERERERKRERERVIGSDKTRHHRMQH
jgi:hypothetical protein